MTTNPTKRGCETPRLFRQSAGALVPWLHPLTFIILLGIFIAGFYNAFVWIMGSSVWCLLLIVLVLCCLGKQSQWKISPTGFYHENGFQQEAGHWVNWDDIDDVRLGYPSHKLGPICLYLYCAQRSRPYIRRWPIDEPRQLEIYLSRWLQPNHPVRQALAFFNQRRSLWQQICFRFEAITGWVWAAK